MSGQILCMGYEFPALKCDKTKQYEPCKRVLCKCAILLMLMYIVKNNR